MPKRSTQKPEKVACKVTLAPAMQNDDDDELLGQDVTVSKVNPPKAAEKRKRDEEDTRYVAAKTNTISRPQQVDTRSQDREMAQRINTYYGRFRLARSAWDLATKWNPVGLVINAASMAAEPLGNLIGDVAGGSIGFLAFATGLSEANKQESMRRGRAVAVPATKGALTVARYAVAPYYSLVGDVANYGIDQLADKLHMSETTRAVLQCTAAELHHQTSDNPVQKVVDSTVQTPIRNFYLRSQMTDADRAALNQAQQYNQQQIEKINALSTYSAVDIENVATNYWNEAVKTCGHDQAQITAYMNNRLQTDYGINAEANSLIYNAMQSGSTGRWSGRVIRAVSSILSDAIPKTPVLLTTAQETQQQLSNGVWLQSSSSATAQTSSTSTASTTSTTSSVTETQMRSLVMDAENYARANNAEGDYYAQAYYLATRLITEYGINLNVAEILAHYLGAKQVYDQDPIHSKSSEPFGVLLNMTDRLLHKGVETIKIDKPHKGLGTKLWHGAMKLANELDNHYSGEEGFYVQANVNSNGKVQAGYNNRNILMVYEPKNTSSIPVQSTTTPAPVKIVGKVVAQKSEKALDNLTKNKATSEKVTPTVAQDPVCVSYQYTASESDPVFKAVTRGLEETSRNGQLTVKGREAFQTAFIPFLQAVINARHNFHASSLDKTPITVRSYNHGKNILVNAVLNVATQAPGRAKNDVVIKAGLDAGSNFAIGIGFNRLFKSASAPVTLALDGIVILDNVTWNEKTYTDLMQNHQDCMQQVRSAKNIREGFLYHAQAEMYRDAASPMAQNHGVAQLYSGAIQFLSNLREKPKRQNSDAHNSQRFFSPLQLRLAAENNSVKALDMLNGVDSKKVLDKLTDDDKPVKALDMLRSSSRM